MKRFSHFIQPSLAQELRKCPPNLNCGGTVRLPSAKVADCHGPFYFTAHPLPLAKAVRGIAPAGFLANRKTVSLPHCLFCADSTDIVPLRNGRLRLPCAYLGMSISENLSRWRLLAFDGHTKTLCMGVVDKKDEKSSFLL